jgi:hypothetical protein
MSVAVFVTGMQQPGGIFPERQPAGYDANGRLPAHTIVAANRYLF